MECATSVRIGESSFRRSALFLSSLLALPDNNRLHRLIDTLASDLDVPIAGIMIQYGKHCWFPVSMGMTPPTQPSSNIDGGIEYGAQVQAAVPLMGVYKLPLGTIFVADHRPRRDFMETALPKLDALVQLLTREAGAPHQIHRFRGMVLEGFEALMREAEHGTGDPVVGAIDRLIHTSMARTNVHQFSANL